MHLPETLRIPDQPYSELRAVLARFTAVLQSNLAQNLVGVYLVGSLATGDFDADSDVDFLVIVNDDLTPAHVPPLEALHRRMHALGSYPAQHLEGSYVSLRDLNDGETVDKKPLYYFDNGSTRCERSVHDNNWHVRWVLRERGIPLWGQRPSTLLPLIPPAALRREMQTHLTRNTRLFAAALAQPLTFMNSQFGQSFIILTHCRILHTLHTGAVHSKKAGAAWARQVVAPRWAPLIDRAWRDREGVRFGLKIRQKADESLLHETLAFMQDVSAQALTGKEPPPNLNSDAV